MNRQSDPRKYEQLHFYLRDRFANRVVLTFAEIEDLMGFHLPDAARLDATWWSSDGATHRRFVAAVARVDSREQNRRRQSAGAASRV